MTFFEAYTIMKQGKFVRMPHSSTATHKDICFTYKEGRVVAFSISPQKELNLSGVQGNPSGIAFTSSAIDSEEWFEVTLPRIVTLEEVNEKFGEVVEIK